MKKIRLREQKEEPRSERNEVKKGPEAREEEPDEDTGFDSASELGSNLEVEREHRRAAPVDADEEEEARAWDAEKTLFAVRWVVAVAMIAGGLWTWLRPTAGADIALDFVVGLLLFGVGFILVVADLLRWGTDFLTDYLGSDASYPKPANYPKVQSLLDEGEVDKALREVEEILKEHPRELRAYMMGIRAAADDEAWEKVRRYNDAAQLYLSEQDLELLNGQLQRMGISVPPSESGGERSGGSG